MGLLAFVCWYTHLVTSVVALYALVPASGKKFLACLAQGTARQSHCYHLFSIP